MYELYIAYGICIFLSLIFLMKYIISLLQVYPNSMSAFHNIGAFSSVFPTIISDVNTILYNAFCFFHVALWISKIKLTNQSLLFIYFNNVYSLFNCMLTMRCFMTRLFQQFHAPDAADLSIIHFDYSRTFIIQKKTHCCHYLKIEPSFLLQRKKSFCGRGSERQGLKQK